MESKTTPMHFSLSHRIHQSRDRRRAFSSRPLSCSQCESSRLKVAEHRFTKWLHCPKQHCLLSSLSLLPFRQQEQKPRRIVTNSQSWPTLIFRPVAKNWKKVHPASGKRLI